MCICVFLCVCVCVCVGAHTNILLLTKCMCASLSPPPPSLTLTCTPSSHTFTDCASHLILFEDSFGTTQGSFGTTQGSFSTTQASFDRAHTVLFHIPKITGFFSWMENRMHGSFLRIQGSFILSEYRALLLEHNRIEYRDLFFE